MNFNNVNLQNFGYELPVARQKEIMKFWDDVFPYISKLNDYQKYCLAYANGQFVKILLTKDKYFYEFEVEKLNRMIHNVDKPNIEELIFLTLYGIVCETNKVPTVISVIYSLKDIDSSLKDDEFVFALVEDWKKLHTFKFDYLK